MFKLGNYAWRRFTEQDEKFHQRLRLIGYVAGVALCYLIPDEWFLSAGVWLRALITLVATRLGLR